MPPPPLPRLVLALGLVLAGCAGALPRQPLPEGTLGFAPPLPLPRPGAGALWLLPVGVGLGLALAWLWRRWRLRRALGQADGQAGPGDMERLRVVLALLEDLALGWRRRAKLVRLGDRRRRKP